MPRSSPPPAVYKKKTNDLTVYRPPQTGGFADVVKQGFALGTGQAIAHHAVGSIVRAFTSPSTVVAEDCSAYTTCLTKVDKETCDTLYETCAAKRSTP